METQDNTCNGCESSMNCKNEDCPLWIPMDVPCPGNNVQAPEKENLNEEPKNQKVANNFKSMKDIVAKYLLYILLHGHYPH